MAQVGLLDVNVLVALVASSHIHHSYARRWVLTEGVRAGWATCPVTELGAIRVCAQLPVGARPPEVTPTWAMARSNVINLPPYRRARASKYRSVTCLGVCDLRTSVTTAGETASGHQT